MLSAEENRLLTEVGPGALAGRFLRRYWHPVMVSADLIAGRPRRLQILNAHYTAYRGEDGVPRIVQDSCPHRQTRLSLGWVEGSDIRCFYHGWKFAADGRCVEQPAEKSAFGDKVRIRSYPARDYLGFVFAYLGEDEAPPFPLFPEIDLAADTAYFNRHPVPCNFFQRIENDLDEVHVHFVHRVSTAEVGLAELPDIDVAETPYGIVRTGERSDAGNNVSRTAHIFMPNVLMTITPGRPSRPEWMLHLAWRVPVDDESMASFIVATRKGGGGGLLPRPAVDPDPAVLTEDVLAGRIRVQDIDPDYPGLFQVQDNVALAGQGRIVDRSKERLGQSDKGIIVIRKLWERELRALAEGRPLKAWRRPPHSLIAERTREHEKMLG